MDRPNFLRTLAVIAAVFTGVGILLNIVVVLNPHIAAILMGYGSIKELMDTELSAGTKQLLLAQAAVPAAFLVLCGVGCFSDKISRSKSLLMLILTVLCFILVTAAAAFLYTAAIRSAVSEGMGTVQLLSSITTIRNFLAYLYTFAFVTLMCANSVELYIAKSEADGK